MLKPTVLLFITMATFATPAWPCSVVGPLPTPHDLVSRAQVIVRARADRLADRPGREGTLAGSRTQIRFIVVAVLKGDLGPGDLEFNGHLEQKDDPNDRPVPFDFIRPGGRSGNCFALGYRQGAEYLLLLRRGDHQSFAQPNDLTPYWTPLAPTNEQLFGDEDPWLRWVSAEIKNRSAGVPNEPLQPTSGVPSSR
jgi:hypothetical protein